MIIGVAVKAGQLMIALPKPNRHANCIDLIRTLGLEHAVECEWGKSLHQGFYDEKGTFYTRPQVFLHAIESGQIEWTENQLVLIALGEMPFSRMGICSEDLW